LGETAGQNGISGRMVVEGREIERGIAGNIIHYTDFMDGQQSVE
jgi:hypothetical protein